MKPLLQQIASHLVQKEFRAVEGMSPPAALEILDKTEHREGGRTVQRTLVFRRREVFAFIITAQVDFLGQILAARTLQPIEQRPNCLVPVRVVADVGQIGNPTHTLRNESGHGEEMAKMQDES